MWSWKDEYRQTTLFLGDNVKEKSLNLSFPIIFSRFIEFYCLLKNDITQKIHLTGRLLDT